MEKTAPSTLPYTEYGCLSGEKRNFSVSSTKSEVNTANLEARISTYLGEVSTCFARCFAWYLVLVHHYPCSVYTDYGYNA